MLTYVQGPRDLVTTVELSADAKQGQWVYRNGANSDGDIQVTPVTAQAHAEKARYLLGVVFKETISVAGGDADYETIYINDGDTTDDGKFPAVAFGGGHMLEDDKLSDRVAADFASAAYGDKMVLTVSGYPTIDGSSDDPSASATVVALFVNKLGDAVTYVTV